MPGDSLNEPGFAGVIIQYSAQFLDALGQRIVADNHILPNRVEKVILFDQMGASLNQQDECVQIPCVHIDALIHIPELPICRVKRLRTELIARRRIHRLYSEMLRKRSDFAHGHDGQIRQFCVEGSVRVGQSFP